MKTKKPFSFALPFLFLFIFNSASGQTYFSGGVYSNTTWTKANSPYIITDTSVVFPGVTLTIEAGVIVEFDSAVVLEIRQGTLIALGTVTDSIIFTSSSLNPSAGIWKGILFNNAVGWQADYCVYEYADNAVNLSSGVNLNVIIQHSSFYYNTNCFHEYYYYTMFRNSSFYNNGICIGGTSQGFTVDSCLFMNNIEGMQQGEKVRVTNTTFIGNQTGIYIQGGGNPGNLIRNCIFCNNTTGVNNYNFITPSDALPPDTFINCNYSQNHIGFSGHAEYMKGNIFADNDTALDIQIDSIGLFLENYIYHNQIGVLYNGPFWGIGTKMMNNKICNNAIYNLQYTAVSNAVFQNNCWCDTDSAAIAAKIYDGYDNVSYGLIKFTPYIYCDSSVITLIPPINCQTLVVTNVDNQEQNFNNSSLFIYPNPANEKLTVVIKSFNHTTLYLCDLTGRIIMEKTFSAVNGENKMEMDVSGVAKGVYFLNAGEGNGVVKVVIE